jgi:site-specific recombinase
VGAGSGRPGARIEHGEKGGSLIKKSLGSLFRRSSRSEQTGHFRARVESCVSTVLELNRKLGEGAIKPEIIQQFERLKESLRHVNEDSVDAKDIDRIEEATNQLLEEIRASVSGDAFPSLYEGERH